MVLQVCVSFVGDQRRKREDLFQLWIGLEESEVTHDDVFDGDVVWMICQG